MDNIKKKHGEYIGLLVIMLIVIAITFYQAVLISGIMKYWFIVAGVILGLLSVGLYVQRDRVLKSSYSTPTETIKRRFSILSVVITILSAVELFLVFVGILDVLLGTDLLLIGIVSFILYILMVSYPKSSANVTEHR
jgi:hypothetical protein